MTANKKSPTGDAAPKGAMPLLPEAPKDQALSFGHTSVELLAFAEAYGRACYLAGLEDAKTCVPEVADEDAYQYDRAEQYGHNNCRNLTLTNLKALEEGVAKGPALERTASGANFPKKEEAKK